MTSPQLHIYLEIKPEALGTHVHCNRLLSNKGKETVMETACSQKGISALLKTVNLNILQT
jgi:hypothetical protein